MIGQFIQKYALVSLTLLSSISVYSADYLVDSPKAYNKIAKQLKAGDTVILKNGRWQDFEILFTGQGTEQHPISLKAQTKGKVILSGNSNLRLAGEYLQVSGLVFKDGYTPSSAVIEFKRNKQQLANHSRVSEVVIDNYSNPDKRESDYWIALYGKHNRIDHNYLVGKRNKGVTVAVRLNGTESQQNHHRIDHNYFGPRPVLGSNGGETIRIGTSHYSMFDSLTQVDHNVFDRCDGEVEIISVKSGKNIIQNNVFFESRGTLTLRHGNGNLVENNIFIGNGVDHTGGIRVINEHQTIRNNYLEGLTGYRFGSGFTVMNGVPNSPVNRYMPVKDAQIEHNSFIDVAHISLAAGSDSERSETPKNTLFISNLFFNKTQKHPFEIFDDISGIQFQQNISNSQVIPELASGIKQHKISLERHSNGLLYPKDKTLNMGVSRDLEKVSLAQVGPTWYAKPQQPIVFGSQRVISVPASGTALVKAIEQAKNGDTLLLSDGYYDVSKLIKINKTIFIKAKNAQKAQVNFERSTLFEIENNGNLKLEGLVISGSASPDAAGNSVVRTQKWGMYTNYRFIAENNRIQNLTINHSFHFFVSGKGAFADEITLKNNQFSGVTGDILQLDKEHEDLGIYNAEYVNVVDNHFEQIQGALLKLYRGGTDESTFGPHFTLVNNSLNNVGLGKRNKTHASVFIHGVQVSHISQNKFVNSAPLVVNHTVGEPKTDITYNQFINTPAPKITELFATGAITALLQHNVMK